MTVGAVNGNETRADICDVHYWAKGDGRKRLVNYCSLCDAWICEECVDNIPRRALAMARRTKARIFDGGLM